MVVLDAGGELRKYKGRSIALFLLNDLIIVAKVRNSTHHHDNNANQSMFNESSFISNGSTIGPRGLATPTRGFTGTLTRQMTVARLYRLGSMHKERKPYRHITNMFFSGVRSVQVVRSHALFVLVLRGVSGFGMGLKMAA